MKHNLNPVRSKPHGADSLAIGRNAPGLMDKIPVISIIADSLAQFFPFLLRE